VAGSCERGDEALGSIKCREFLDWLRKNKFQKGALLFGVNSYW
jgi:hypothetical protein